MKPDWAREKVEANGYLSKDLHKWRQDIIVGMLRAERARARRVVRATQSDYDNDRIAGDFTIACNEILRRLK